jgi:hypothetical protein
MHDLNNNNISCYYLLLPDEEPPEELPEEPPEEPPEELPEEPPEEPPDEDPDEEEPEDENELLDSEPEEDPLLYEEEDLLLTELEGNIDPLSAFLREGRE